MLKTCSGWIGVTKTIEWDETETSVTATRLVVSRVHSDRDPVDIKVRVNGSEVKSFFYGEGTKCTYKSAVVSIPLVNGANLIEMRSCKKFFWIGNVGTLLTGYIEMEYEGKAPERPPLEAIKANWFLLLPVAVLGGVAVGISRRKKK